MSCKIKCRTLFDITATGVRSNYNSSRIPFVDENGNKINTTDSWKRSRNQQRNWETINQIISLRTLPYDISTPIKTHDDSWEFEFTIDAIESVSNNNSNVGALLQDSQGVPMILGLDETQVHEPVLRSDSEKINIWFIPVPTK